MLLQDDCCSSRGTLRAAGACSTTGRHQMVLSSPLPSAFPFPFYFPPPPSKSGSVYGERRFSQFRKVGAAAFRERFYRSKEQEPGSQEEITDV